VKKLQFTDSITNDTFYILILKDIVLISCKNKTYSRKHNWGRALNNDHDSIKDIGKLFGSDEIAGFIIKMLKNKAFW
jgi:hypothetical protein